jgi:hypothetical protein
MKRFWQARLEPPKMCGSNSRSNVAAITNHEGDGDVIFEIVNDNRMRLFVDTPRGADHEGPVVIPDPCAMPEFGPWMWSLGVKVSIWPVHSPPRVMPLSEVEVIGDDFGGGDAADHCADAPPDSLMGRSSSGRATR